MPAHFGQAATKVEKKWPNTKYNNIDARNGAVANLHIQAAHLGTSVFSLQTTENARIANKCVVAAVSIPVFSFI